jgi:hypothetical protein
LPARALDTDCGQLAWLELEGGGSSYGCAFDGESIFSASALDARRSNGLEQLQDPGRGVLLVGH